ncbi:hypothetical protein BB776_00110 [Planococcus salinarum]|uniref:N-acetyltransferase domain-containing protein n=1 Tax=Planococcus salinarum TaxID=622695 RepID=A0ABX3D353_9BACL|nr:hypothetical protein BB776_00110 [Planococcus salinarum]
MEIKSLSECTVEQAVVAWNRGFEGYQFDMATTTEAFSKRMETEELSKELSVMAFAEGEPVGLVLNGIRQSGNWKIGWNGGTGVAVPWRKKGVGKEMMEKTFQLLKAEGVEIATLEAIAGNGKAIELYKKLGYEIVDDLFFLQLDGAVDGKKTDGSESYSIRPAEPEEIGTLPFYRGDFPWQTHWQSVRDGEGRIVANVQGQDIGYAFFRTLKDEQGNAARTILYQCETDPKASEREEIAGLLIDEVFGHFRDSINRTAVNVPVTENAVTYQVLKDKGFEKSIAQVFMKKKL